MKIASTKMEQDIAMLIEMTDNVGKSIIKIGFWKRCSCYTAIEVFNEYFNLKNHNTARLFRWCQQKLMTWKLIGDSQGSRVTSKLRRQNFHKGSFEFFKMILMTMVARVADGLPLTASIQEDEQVCKKWQIIILYIS